MPTARFTLVVFLFALLQFCLFLNHRDITTAHEGRVAATAREMLQRHEWLIPYCNDVPRIAKPPLPYWAVMSGWKAYGQIEVWVARFPSALMGALAVVFMMDLGRRMLGRLGAILCGLIWVSTWFIVDEYRKAMADPYLAFFTLLCVWSWIAADQSERRRPRGTLQNILILLFYISAGVATLAKGHLILFHLAITLIPYHLTTRRPPQRRFVHAIGIIVFLLLALPWPIYISRAVPNVLSEWRREVTGAYATAGLKSSPLWFYLRSVFETSAPWSIFAVIGFVAAFVGPSRFQRRARWPAIWFALGILLFSLVPMKKNAYLLPLMPAQTMLAAAPIAFILRQANRKRANLGDKLLFAGHALAAIAAFVIVLYLTGSLEIVGVDAPAPMLFAGGVALFILLGATSLSPRLLSLRTVALIALAFALAIHGAEGWLVPDHDNRRSDASFADAANNSSVGGKLVFIGPGPREDVLFYLGHPVPVFPSIDKLVPDFKGCAIVTADQREAANRSERGGLVASTNVREEKDRLYLFQIPPPPPQLMNDRR